MLLFGSRVSLIVLMWNVSRILSLSLLIRGTSWLKRCGVLVSVTSGHITQISRLKSHYLCSSSKLAMTDWLSHFRLSWEVHKNVILIRNLYFGVFTQKWIGNLILPSGLGDIVITAGSTGFFGNICLYPLHTAKDIPRIFLR